MQQVWQSVRIVFVYALFATAWIFFSDAVLDYFVTNIALFSILQTYKGLFFIFVTSVLLYILIRANIQEIYRSQKKIYENRQRLEYVLKGANLGYWDWNYQTNQQWVNDQWLSFLGLERSDIKEEITDWSEAIHPEDMLISQKAIEQTIKEGKPYTIEFRMRHKEGHWVWIEGSGAVVEWDEKKRKPLRLAGTHRDISERKSSEEKMRLLALKDPLTGLPNRTYLKEEFNRFLEHASPFAFLFLDLDLFKNINDLYGHSVGDRVIQEVARRFSDTLKEDDFIARVGGDEFVIVTQRLHVKEICERCINALHEPFEAGSEKVGMGVSIGVALYPQDGKDFESLFKYADIAMYEAKSSGKNKIAFYQDAMSERIVRSTKLDYEIQKAIENDEFILHYQPLVDIQQEDKIIGAEALVRWMHPEKGLISPLEFIPRAEETHAIIPLGKLIVQKAFRQLKIWQENGTFLGKMAINISTLQLEHDDFLSCMASMCTLMHINSASVELEITESFIMRNPQKSIEILQKLKNMGFSIAIDDFGTGYSSLSYLKTLPIHKLKIDRSFIRDISHDNEDRAIVRAIIAMAKNLELEVLAEGVETQAQERFLIENWCDSAQGYYFAKPMNAEDFERFMRKN